MIGLIPNGVYDTCTFSAWPARFPNATYLVRQPRTREEWRKYYRAADECARLGAKLRFRAGR